MSEWKRSDYPIGALVKFTETNLNEYRNTISPILAVEGILDRPYEEFTLLINVPGGRLRVHPSKVEIVATSGMIYAPCVLVPVTRKRKRLGDIRGKV